MQGIWQDGNFILGSTLTNTITKQASEIARLKAENEELRRDAKNRCECGAKLNLNGCLACGAPVCCPSCCTKNSMEMYIERLEKKINKLRENNHEMP